MSKFIYTLVYVVLWPICHLIYPMKVIGQSNIPSGACVFCANHSNFIDPLLLIYAVGLKYKLHTMSKKENMDLPVIGKLYTLCGAFPVDRVKMELSTARKVISLLKDGHKVTIFPEGTRKSENDENAGKSGAVRFAAKSGVPILPVFITRNKKVFRRVHVKFGQPYFPDKTTTKESQEQTKELMTKIFALGESL